MTAEPTRPFFDIPEPPAYSDGTGVLIRFVDALGFRFRWATEGLREEDGTFKPCESAMPLFELVKHVHGLVGSATNALVAPMPPGGPAPTTLNDFRNRTLSQLFFLRTQLRGKTETDLLACKIGVHPFWNILNGPLSDALTHVGQINTYRRAAGNPCPKGVGYLSGKAPIA